MYESCTMRSVGARCWVLGAGVLFCMCPFRKERFPQLYRSLSVVFPKQMLAKGVSYMKSCPSPPVVPNHPNIHIGIKNYLCSYKISLKASTTSIRWLKPFVWRHCDWSCLSDEACSHYLPQTLFQIAEANKRHTHKFPPQLLFPRKPKLAGKDLCDLLLNEEDKLRK